MVFVRTVRPRSAAISSSLFPRSWANELPKDEGIPQSIVHTAPSYPVNHVHLVEIPF